MPILVKRCLTDLGAWQDGITLDESPFVVGDVARLTKDNGRDWIRFLKAARKDRRNLGAVLLVLDGDASSIRREQFCAANFAARLADLSKSAGGGSVFSVACVFARMEFESWILACAEKLAGQCLPDGREGLPSGTKCPEGDLESAPRDAKGWLAERLPGGYKETVDQELFAQMIKDHFEVIQARNLRSFRRFVAALRELHEALRSERHVVSPVKRSLDSDPAN